MNELGKKVKEIRKANKLSQQAFADALGYSHKSVINKIESGQRDMSYEKILLMVKVFNLDIKDVEDMVPKKKTKPKKIKKEKRLAVYIHGYISGTDHTPFYSSFLNKYDFKNLDYKDGIPWEVGPIIKEEFEKLGITITLEGDNMIIEGGQITGGRVNSHKDHRMAMALAIAALNSQTPVQIDDADAVNKSYPKFWDDFEKSLKK